MKYEVNVKFNGSEGWQKICDCYTKEAAKKEIEHQKHIEDEGDCEYNILEKRVDIPRKDYKLQILNEIFNQVEQTQPFSEWVKLESENDPGFFRWLFEIDELEDFFCVDEESFSEFLNTLSEK